MARARIPWLALGLTLAAASAALGQPAPADPPPPSLEGEIDTTLFDDGNRAIMVRVAHTPAPQPPSSILLVKARAYVRRGDEGPIDVEIRDRTGKLLDQWRAPRPGAEGGEGLRDTEGRYAIPYSKALAIVRIADRETGDAVEFKVDPVVAAFCAADPSDVACDKIDLTADISLDDGSPRILKVGESLDIPVTARFGNLQGETEGVSAAVAPFFVDPITSFTTEDPTSLTVDRVDGSFSRVLTITYRLTCLAPGAGRIFPEAVIAADGGAHVVDVDPTNNRWNTWFDVQCLPA